MKKLSFVLVVLFFISVVAYGQSCGDSGSDRVIEGETIMYAPGGKITLKGGASAVGGSIILKPGDGMSGDGNVIMDLTTASRVGIGTASPTDKLHVNGTVRMNNFKLPTGAVNGYVLTSDGNGLGTWQAVSGGGECLWDGDSSETYYMGNVGVGISDPAYKLDVNGAIRVTDFRLPTGASAGYVLTSDGNGVGTWQEIAGGGGSLWSANGDEIYYNTGNVGIGTTTPNSKLSVGGSGTTDAAISGTGTSMGVYGYGDVGVHGSSNNIGVRAYGTNYDFYTEHSDGKSYFAGNVGIGTDNPFERLHVDGKLRVGGLNGTTNYGLIIDPLDGYNVKFECTPSGTKAINFEVWDDLMMRIYNDGNPNGGSVTFPSGNVGIGTTDLQSKLTVNGTITAEEIEVQVDIQPDFVFENNYKLMPLDELEKVIKKEKSLPGIPTSEEAVEKGVKLGDMQAKLLQKVEELTLYVIEQNKEIAELKERISRLEK